MKIQIKSTILVVCLFIGFIAIVYNQPIERSVYTNEYYTSIQKLLNVNPQPYTEFSALSFYAPVYRGGAQDVHVKIRTDRNLTVIPKSPGAQPYPREINVTEDPHEFNIRFFNSGPHEIKMIITEPREGPPHILIYLYGFFYERKLQTIEIDSYPYAPLGSALVATSVGIFVYDATYSRKKSQMKAEA